jgi:hypothetical protein
MRKFSKQELSISTVLYMWILLDVLQTPKKLHLQINLLMLRVSAVMHNFSFSQQCWWWRTSSGMWQCNYVSISRCFEGTAILQHVGNCSSNITASLTPQMCLYHHHTNISVTWHIISLQSSHPYPNTDTNTDSHYNISSCGDGNSESQTMLTDTWTLCYIHSVMNSDMTICKHTLWKCTRMREKNIFISLQGPSDKLQCSKMAYHWELGDNMAYTQV